MATCPLLIGYGGATHLRFARSALGSRLSLVVALVVTPEGLPLVYEMFPGITRRQVKRRDEGAIGHFVTYKKAFRDMEQWFRDIKK